MKNILTFKSLILYFWNILKIFNNSFYKSRVLTILESVDRLRPLKNKARKSQGFASKNYQLKTCISAMHGTNINLNIFTDITMPDRQSYHPNTGKKSQVLTGVFFSI
jgi:hypothetical protein